VPQQDVDEILREIGRCDVLRTGIVARERIFLDRSGDIIGVVRTPQTQISWDLLFSAFRNEVSEDRYHLNRRICGVEVLDKAIVQFDDGSAESADLVIGADGIGSVVRRMVAPGTEPRYAGYVAFRGLAPESELPPSSAEVVSERFTFFDTPRSQFLGYLVAGPDGSTEQGQRRYNWVWYRSLTDAQLQSALISNEGERREYSAPPSGLSEETKKELRGAADNFLPPVLRDIVIREPRPFLQAIFDYETPKMWSDRVVLVGDAAFVVRPHTAMGVSKAAGDAMALRDALLAEPSVELALERYSGQRMPVGTAIARYGQKLGEQFAFRE
jgi:2-polyprenyl-6-methoxyphenol hydroxylase-like FAD-dependent oxidoreductase